MVPMHKIETFRGAWDYFGPLNGTSDSEGHFGAKKVARGSNQCWEKENAKDALDGLSDLVCVVHIGPVALAEKKY